MDALQTMKLVVTIPAFNEEETLGMVIKEIPQSVVGFDSLEILVIDDGSTDKTTEIALKSGATRVISHTSNKGLATAFRTGLKTALNMDADVIVNIDADGQYDAMQISNLVKPILTNKADMVLGSRFAGYIEEMPYQKRIGNILATYLTRVLSGYSTTDAQTGFRALKKDLAGFLKITSKKTYVQETIIRAAKAGYRIVEVPITFRKRVGESRLIKNIWGYAFKVFPDLIRCLVDIYLK